MLSFDASSFAIAGAIAAAGPILIHLLNRRRFKTVNWAAMDFLREAIERNRKILHLRDILLLALRMLAVLLFGLMLSRPFFKGEASAAIGQALLLGLSLLVSFGFAIGWVTSRNVRSKSFCATGMFAGLIASGFQFYGIARQSADLNESVASARAPVHAVLVIDNSRSLGVESLGGTLLDRAKGKGAEFIDSLPPESRITVIPLAGSEDPYTLDAYRNKDDARRALDRVKLVDAEGGVRAGLELAELACRQTADPPSKRVVVITDLQASAWQSAIPVELMHRLSGLQVVNVTTTPSRNVWVSGLHIEDGLTSSEVPCRLLARLHASGTGTIANVSAEDESFEVQVKLLIDGAEAASQVIDLTPGQEREVEFTHQFDLLADPLKPGSAVVTIAVQPGLASSDQLPADNRQQIVVPIVASLPVVFIDQVGDQENLEQNKIGETYSLRHLMAPRSSADKSQRRLIHVQHIRPDEVTQELLETARLVVVAGLEKPDEATVPLLRDFVQQGGPLVILAGGAFDPAAWTERAWLSGQGILPAPLDPKPIGFTPDAAPGQLHPFYALFGSMQHDFFLIEGEDPRVLSSLFEATPFFKAVRADLSPSVLENLVTTETRRFSDERSFLDKYLTRSTTQKDRAAAGMLDEDDLTFRRLEPMWWNWRSALPLVDRSLAPAELAKRSQPRVLAAFDKDQGPFVVERRVGAGRIVLFTSGVTSDWNLLRGSAAMYVFHRTFCQLMEGTLPTRNYLAGQKVTLPVERRSDIRYLLTRPTGVKEPLNVDVISANISGVTIRRPVLAGTYAVSSEQADTGSYGSTSNRLDEISLAVNGSENESNLTAISIADLQQKLGHDDVRILAADEPIRLEGGARRGQDLWKQCGWCVLGCLLIEMMVLARPSLGKTTQVAQ
jgi:Aerotolerance regulator N-terminal/von Willebrand factor type A domain